LEEYHRLFDIYYEYSGVTNLRTLNKNAGGEAMKVDGKLIEFLLYAKELYEATDGEMNIMMGSVLRLWHDCRTEASEKPTEARIPDADELSRAALHTDFSSLEIDAENGTVRISDPEASIDVGAIAKGYAASKLAERLKALGAESVAINAGGNIITIGLKPDGNKWVTGITNPDRTSDNSLICKVEIGETSLVTSGNYERYFVSGNNIYHHVIDPATLMPADYFASVSIFASDSGLADSLSTALFCMSYEEGLSLVKKLGGVEVIWIYDDGTIKYTDGVLFAD
jgi:thiamine biosynthesis lipoprotein